MSMEREPHSVSLCRLIDNLRILYAICISTDDCVKIVLSCQYEDKKWKLDPGDGGDYDSKF